MCTWKESQKAWNQFSESVDVKYEELYTRMVIKMMTSENDKSHGGLMMRLGAIAFGLGTLIYSGLEFVHFFETPFNCSRCRAVLKFKYL